MLNVVVFKCSDFAKREDRNVVVFKCSDFAKREDRNILSLLSFILFFIKIIIES